VKMAGLINDTEEQRIIDRIRAITYKELKNEGVEFITKKWVCEKLKRSRTWVTDNWNKSLEEVKKSCVGGRPEVLSQESKDIIKNANNKRKESCSRVVNELKIKRSRLEAVKVAAGGHTNY